MEFDFALRGGRCEVGGDIAETNGHGGLLESEVRVQII